MRKKIQELAYGIFRWEKPALVFEEDRLEITVLEGDRYVGGFSFRSAGETPLRGFVYSTNPRIKCLRTEFEGVRVSIPFEFHSEGLTEGDVQKGDFYVICDGGEYNLSFVVSVTRFYTRSSLGKIRNLSEFANLAQEFWVEAYHMFQAPAFANVIRDTERRERLLYQALGGSGASQQAMEEFLIGIRKKQPVELRLASASLEYGHMERESMEHLSVRRSHWGYIAIRLSSDNEAVTLLKRELTTDDFVGDLAEVSFIIHPERLHGGRNYARLTLCGVRQKEACQICIDQGGGPRERRKAGREKRKLQAQLTELYLRFRLQRMDAVAWSRESVEQVRRLRELEPDNLWYVLYQAQALTVGQQRQEAEHCLDRYRKAHCDKKSAIHAYYLYVTAVQERESSHVAKNFRKIQEIYHQNQDNLWLFLMLLFLNPQIGQNDGRKMEAIRERVEAGENSPLLLLEAFCLMKRAPGLLQELGIFQRRVLYWAARRQAMTAELAERVMELAPQVKRPHMAWQRILQECCRANDSRDMLKALCGCFIKWNLLGKEEFAWYDRGVKAGLRIAGLYEAWLACAEMERLCHLPRSVALYFRHQSLPDDRKMAMLYRCVLERKEADQGQFEAYRERIWQFAMESLMKGRIDRNLAVLYEGLLQEAAITEEMAKRLEELLFVHSVSCEDGRAKRLVALTVELSGEQTVSLSSRKGHVALLSANYVILAEDEFGSRYVPGEMLELGRLMPMGRYLKRCMRAGRPRRNFLLTHLEGRRDWQAWQEEDLMGWLRLLRDESVSGASRRELMRQLIAYYHQGYSEAGLEEFLVRVDCRGLPRAAKNQLLELLVDRGSHQRAYDLLLTYGSEQAPVSKLTAIAEWRMRQLEDKEDAFLLGLCGEIFQRGQCGAQILRYLMLYMKGNVRKLERLWVAARELDLDAGMLEERFLTQLLYTEGYTEQMEHIFDSYFTRGGDNMAIMAYLTWHSHQYVMQQTLMGDATFARIQQQIELENPLNDSCRLACFQWLARLRGRTPQQEQLLERLFLEYLEQKRYFSFYNGLPRSLLRKQRMNGCVILEYCTQSAQRVFVNYSMGRPGYEDVYLEEELLQMYAGVYGGCFVLFFGEEVSYYIREDRGEESVITQSGWLERRELMEQGADSMYGLINDMMISYCRGDLATLRQLYGQYQEKSKRAEECFQVL